MGKYVALVFKDAVKAVLAECPFEKRQDFEAEKVLPVGGPNDATAVGRCVDRLFAPGQMGSPGAIQQRRVVPPRLGRVRAALLYHKCLLLRQRLLPLDSIRFEAVERCGRIELNISFRIPHHGKHGLGKMAEIYQ